MKKKVLATLLVGAMAASLLAGCGTTVETTGSSDTTTAPEKTQTTETAEAGEAGGSDVSADITLWQTHYPAFSCLERLAIFSIHGTET